MARKRWIASLLMPKWTITTSSPRLAVSWINWRKEVMKKLRIWCVMNLKYIKDFNLWDTVSVYSLGGWVLRTQPRGEKYTWSMVKPKLPVIFTSLLYVLMKHHADWRCHRSRSRFSSWQVRPIWSLISGWSTGGIDQAENTMRRSAAFTQLYGERVTINNQGDDDRLLWRYLSALQVKVWEETHRIMGLIDELQAKYQVGCIWSAWHRSHLCRWRAKETESGLYGQSTPAGGGEVEKVKNRLAAVSQLPVFPISFWCRTAIPRGSRSNLDFDSFVRIAGNIHCCR